MTKSMSKTCNTMISTCCTCRVFHLRFMRCHSRMIQLYITMWSACHVWCTSMQKRNALLLVFNYEPPRSAICKTHPITYFNKKSALSWRYPLHMLSNTFLEGIQDYLCVTSVEICLFPSSCIVRISNSAYHKVTMNAKLGAQNCDESAAVPNIAETGRNYRHLIATSRNHSKILTQNCDRSVAASKITWPKR